MLWGNPQLLVNNIQKAPPQNDEEQGHSIDAIFIPFKDRIGNVKGLLHELRWFHGNIHLMPSSQTDVAEALKLKGAAVDIILPQDSELQALRARQRSSHHAFTHHNGFWDLPQKRNHALVLSTRARYRNILLLDDDIRGVSEQKFKQASRLLKEYSVTGCFVDDFPDTSVFGHLLRAAGEDVRPFLSGSFLFIKIGNTPSFFPDIYDEDWLFMIPHVINRSISSFGSIMQLPHNPFDSPLRASFQEFGDTIVDGLFQMVASNTFSNRYQTECWSDVINARREVLMTLAQKLPEQIHQEAISAALTVSRSITARDCVDFIIRWEDDVGMWNEFIEETIK